MRLNRAGVLLTLLPATAAAHAGAPLEPHDLWSAWEFDPGVIAPLLIAAVLYRRGMLRDSPAGQPGARLFWTGWLVLALALVSPLHALGEALFSAHMVQHEVLMVVAAPLLVLSRPLSPLLRGLPAQLRRAIAGWMARRAVRRASRAATAPASAWCIHAAALWVWHAPALFQATLTSEWAHAAQHSTFLGAALFYWWSLLHARGRAGRGTAVFSLFTTSIQTGILGALLTLTSGVWYPAYGVRPEAWGLTPLEDQQLGGLIMWIPAGAVYLAAALILFAGWLRMSDAGGANCGDFLQEAPFS